MINETIDFIGYNVGQSRVIIFGFFDFTGIPIGQTFISPSGEFFDIIMV